MQSSHPTFRTHNSRIDFHLVSNIDSVPKLTSQSAQCPIRPSFRPQRHVLALSASDPLISPIIVLLHAHSPNEVSPERTVRSICVCGARPMNLKECSHVTKFFTPKFGQKLFINVENRISVQMGPSPIQSLIQPITIDIMLNNNRLNIDDGWNFVKCEQTFNQPLTALFTKPPTW